MGHPSLIVLMTEGLTGSWAEAAAESGPFGVGGFGEACTHEIRRDPWQGRADAWSSLLTGGIGAGEGEALPADAPTWLRVAGEAGCRVAAVHVPLVDHSQIVNGIGVPCPDRMTPSTGEIAEDLMYHAEATAEDARHVVQSCGCDLLAVGFTPWSRLDPWEMTDSRSSSAQVLSHAMERLFLRLQDLVAAQGAVILVSACHPVRVHTHLHLNSWLRERGWLVVRRGQRFHAWLRRPQCDQEIAPRWIDWRRTAAYATSVPHAAIRIGSRRHGAGESGVSLPDVTEVVSELSGAVFRTTGRPLVARAWVPGGRDRTVAVEPCDEGVLLCTDLKPVMAAAQAREPRLCTGGVCAMSGSPFGHTHEGPLELRSIGPLALHVLGVPLPDWMPGEVPLACLEESWRAAHPVSRVRSPEGPSDSEGISSSDQARIEAHLRALGYMG